MPSSTPSRLSKFNIPLIVLWVASVVVGVAGYLLLLSSNKKEAAIYTAGKADYPKLFAAQSGGTIGGLLVAVGVLGLLLALTAMVLTRRPVVTPTVAVVEVDEFDDDDSDESDFDDSDDDADDIASAPGAAESGRPVPLTPDVHAS